MLINKWWLFRDYSDCLESTVIKICFSLLHKVIMKEGIQEITSALILSYWNDGPFLFPLPSQYKSGKEENVQVFLHVICLPTTICSLWHQVLSWNPLYKCALSQETDSDENQLTLPPPQARANIYASARPPFVSISKMYFYFRIMYVLWNFFEYDRTGQIQLIDM